MINFFTWIGVIVCSVSAGVGLAFIIIWLLEQFLKRVEVIGAVIEYIVYRREFKQFRKDQKKGSKP